MDEEDIYGEDIYGGRGEMLARDTHLGSTDRITSHMTASSSAEIATLKQQLADSIFRVQELEAQLMASLASTDEWREAVSLAAGIGVGQQLDPSGAAAEVRRLRTALEKAQGQPVETGPVNVQREAAKQVQLAQRNLENVVLRRQAHSAQQYAFPSVSQVGQLLLDPAVQRQFRGSLVEMENMTTQAKALQEELQAVQFSQDSKAGRMLMAKCRALQEENEEMGKEVAEGKVHSLERQVALAKSFAQEVGAKYVELEDHLHALDQENEGLHQQVFLLNRQLREADTRDRQRPFRESFKPMQTKRRMDLPGPPGRAY